MLPTVRLKKFEQRRLLAGHLWVFSNEIGEVDAEAETGSVVRVEDAAHNLLGMGLYHQHSLIAVRMLTRKEETIDRAFLATRLAAANALRSALFPGSTAYRLAHGESDLLPGLLIDRYNDAFVVQILSAGMQRFQDDILGILRDDFAARVVIARNDSSLRVLEGLSAENATLLGEPAPVVISDGIVEFEIDLVEGQKTGFFFDQRENRKAIRPFCANARVLDCHTNIGGFALHAATAGAREVIGVDSSERAIAAAGANAERNGVDGVCTWLRDDAHTVLKRFADARERFDVVVLDPPAFAKSKKSLKAAITAYEELQTLGLLLVREGGVLATSSCSHHVTRELFDEIIATASSRTRKRLQILERRGAAGDHPALSGMPETEYLKFVIGRVV